MSKIEIECCLSQSSSALRIDSDGAAKILLETDSTQLAEVLKLMQYSGKTFKVRIE